MCIRDRFNPFINRTKIKVRNASPLSPGNPPSNQNEYALKLFWRHVNTFYFKKIDEPELERLDYLMNMLNTPIKDFRVKYACARAYWAVKDHLRKEVIITAKADPTSRLNLSNMLRQYYITVHCSPLVERPLLGGKESVRMMTEKFQIKPRNFLAEESAKLDALMQEVNAADLAKNPIQAELARLRDELRSVNEENRACLEASLPAPPS
eukprot:TRINITY_DN1941_c0_g1_i10.p1 TRINITY_DN1941_c0_g1~~TRINITY_DN1941_c0_g1_i10.p1  ORF type:complete len:209 (+),score=40.87 TRINITY_DN1941_c0_g1_i10:65-691(+)